MARGPLSDIRMMSDLGFLKYRGLTGTGFAQPKLKRKRHTAPSGSMCLSGLRVSRPMALAVGSPREKAAFPWAYSWTVMAKRRTGIFRIHSQRSNDIE